MRAEVEGPLQRLSVSSSADESFIHSPRAAISRRRTGSQSSLNSRSTTATTNGGKDRASPVPPMPTASVKTSSLGLRDELDEKAYMYSLRVGYINNLLHRAFAQPAKSRSSAAPSPAAIASFSSPPTGSSYFLQPSPALSTTTSNLNVVPPLLSPTASRRGSFWGAKKKKDEEGVKLPKEFLVHFWEVLGSEGGDAVWRTSVNTFMSHLPSKKATKTPSGMNLREVPNLLEAFSSTLPSSPTAKSLFSNTGGSQGNHHQQAHLLSLLLQSLQSWFAPLGKNGGEKDRELHFRLRAEIETYCLPDNEMQPLSPPSNGTEGIPPPKRRGSSFASIKTGPPTSPMEAMKTPLIPPLPGKEKEMKQLDLVEVVGRVFGVGKNKIERDLDNLKRGGVDEKSYMSDLKIHLASLNSSDPAKLSRPIQDRIDAIQTEISNLLQACPHVGMAQLTPADPHDVSRGHALYFTPTPNKTAVYTRLVERIYTLLDVETPPVRGEFGEAELLDVCAGIWGVEGKRILELGVAFSFWKRQVRDSPAGNETVSSRMKGKHDSGSGLEDDSDAMAWAYRVRDNLEDVATDADGMLMPSEETSLRLVLTEMHNSLMSLLKTALRSIYPTRNYPPPSPSPSCVFLINALHACPLVDMLPKELKIESWLDAADEIRAGAVGDYVEKTQEFLSNENINRQGMLHGFEQTADWMENGLRRVAVAWQKNALAGRLDPPAVILSKQLPLYLAEMQVLEQPQAGSKADDIFGLYDRTSKLVRIWEELLPEQPLAFDVDSFFEPHVREWLKGTEEVESHDWVSRAISMDSWVPEGSFRHSQSVIDLFEFIRASAKTILTDLPLGEYNRACYLIDFSRSASVAISQYATTVQALYVAEISPAAGSMDRSAEQPAAVAGKAGAWLAKGKQAVKSLERKKVEGFVISPTACVKLTDMYAAKSSTEDLMVAIGADETAQIVRQHKLQVNGAHKDADRIARYIFSVNVVRGENLLNKNLGKPADAFVTLQDVTSSTRVLKTGTVIGRLDPTWEEAVEISISSAKMYEISCWDRLLVGKHDLIGKTTFKLDPNAFKDQPSRDVVLPLNPRGVVHLRIEMEGGEKHEARFYLNRAIRSLDRAADEMTRKTMDRMSEFIRSQLSSQAIQALLKQPGKGKKAVAKTSSSEEELEASLLPLFDYFDQVFSTFSVTLPDTLKIHMMHQVWDRVLDILISLLIPPLSDKEATGSALSAQEIRVVFQWLKVLKSFFNANENDQEHGVPLNILSGGLYKELVLVGQYLDLPTPALKEKCVAAIKGTARRGKVTSPTSATRQTSIALASNSHSVGDEEERTAEILLRILRMRPQTTDFLGNSIGQLNQARMQRQGGL